MIEVDVSEDGRLYVIVEIYGVRFFGLLDSGATASFLGSNAWDQISRNKYSIIGQESWERLQKSNIKLQRCGTKSVRVANGGQCEVLGRVDAPVVLDGRMKVCSFLVVPSLKQDVILGVDFWRLFGLLPDVVNGTCVIAESDIPELSEVVVSKDKLSEEERKMLESLISNFKSTLGKPGLGCTDKVQHVIDTGDAPPVRQRYYSYSPKLLNVLHEGLEEWLQLGVVEASNSPWASAVLLVKKSDGSYRWVVDLRSVNKVTKADSYPLPKVNDILDQLRDAKYISSIDLKSAYFQIPLEESSKEKTAFIIPGKGLFQFKRMPQGLHTSAATWQRFIDSTLGEDLKPHVFVYLDDIVIVSQTFEQHMSILEKVLQRLEGANLTINFAKSQFCRSELKYLGYVVDEDGLHVDPEKVSAIAEFRRPDTVRQLKRYTGMASWYRRFVPNFSTIMAPLHALTKQKVKWIWTQECEDSFLLIKEKLMSAPVLTCPDFSKPFDLYCDASGVGLGAVLSQEGRPVAFASRTLTAGERKYFPTELECLAVLWAIEKFRGYLEGYKFNVITDHASLKWLDNLKDPCGRLGRWAVRLQQFDYTITHRKGKEHEAPDALSRNPLPYHGDSIELVTVEEEPQDKWYRNLKTNVEADPEKFPSWKVEGNQIFKLVSLGLGPAQWNRVVPKDLREKVLFECHDSPLAGHLGVNKTYERVREKYYWPKMKSDIRTYLATCVECLQYKVPQCKPAGTMGDQRKVTAPFQFISSDVMGPFPRSHSGHNFLIVSTCLFSKYVWLRPVRKATAANIVKHLEEDIFLKYSVPGTLLCDNAKQYAGVEVQALCKRYGVKLKHSFFYHAQANPTERANRVVKTMIASYVRGNHKTWGKNLPRIQMAINSVKHDVTGYSPHELVFGEKWKDHGSFKFVGMDGQNIPQFDIRQVDQKKVLDIQEDVVKRLHQAYMRNAKYYNLRRRPVTFSIGQVVYRRNRVQSNKAKGITSKLAPKFIGPFRVSKSVGHRGYLLVDSSGVEDGPWHVEDLKPGPDSEERFIDDGNDDDDDSQLENADVIASVDCPSQAVNLCTWNVAGFRAFVKKGGWDTVLKENFDVICLQEVKCNFSSWAKLSLPGGYLPYWFSSNNPGYGGVAILSKSKPIKSSSGFGNGSPDGEARLITVWFSNFILVSVYAPYSGEYLFNLHKRMAWEDKFFCFLQSLRKEGLPVVLSGDFNVAADVDLDVDAREIYPFVAGATLSERTAFKRVLNLGFCDVFRQLNPSVRDAYSFWSYGGNKRAKNRGWRLDYFLVTTDILGCVHSIEIRKDMSGSDHCPVHMKLLLQ